MVFFIRNIIVLGLTAKKKRYSHEDGEQKPLEGDGDDEEEAADVKDVVPVVPQPLGKTYRGYIGYILGLYGDNGKENGNYYNGSYGLG